MENKQIIKIITSIRRCRKSTLLKMFRNKLIAEDVNNIQITWLNFEDLNNEPYLTYGARYAHIKSRLQNGKMNYLFFDEIQVVENFPKVIDSLFLLDNVDIYLRGSNVYMLSGEIATLLTGRYVEIKMHHLFFKEYASTYPDTISPETIYRNYITYGAFQMQWLVEKLPTSSCWKVLSVFWRTTSAT